MLRNTNVFSYKPTVHFAKVPFFTAFDHECSCGRPGKLIWGDLLLSGKLGSVVIHTKSCSIKFVIELFRWT
jgi:hypothetical protein